MRGESVFFKMIDLAVIERQRIVIVATCTHLEVGIYPIKKAAFQQPFKTYGKVSLLVGKDPYHHKSVPLGTSRPFCG